jgi:hypothetical protein
MLFNTKKVASVLLLVTSFVGVAIAVPTTQVQLNTYTYANKVFSGQIYVSAL